MRIRPCIDIHDGRVKQIVGGTLRDDSVSTNYVSDRGADYYAEIYKEKGLSGGHIILLNPVSDSARYEADRAQALSALRTYPKGMQVGGGITAEAAENFLREGASHVIVTSYVFRDGRLDMKRLERMVQTVSREHLVLDLSCRRTEDGSYAVVTDRWQKRTDLCVERETLNFLSGYCDEFLIHAADAEGRRAGIQEELVRLLGSWQQESGFPVTYAGGVHAYDDLDVVKNLSEGRMDVTVGSALDLFGGELELDALVRRCRDGSVGSGKAK